MATECRHCRLGQARRDHGLLHDVLVCEGCGYAWEEIGTGVTVAGVASALTLSLIGTAFLGRPIDGTQDNLV